MQLAKLASQLSLLGGVILGISLIVTVCYKLIRSKELPSKGWLLCIVGVILIGLPIWKNVEVEVPGGFTAKWEFDKATKANEDVAHEVEKMANNIEAIKGQFNRLTKILEDKQIINRAQLQVINEPSEQVVPIDLIRLKTATSTLEYLTKED